MSRFATTQWNLVLAARDGSETQARQALEALCEAYWFPLYAYVRHRGHGADAARDLTQAFFADLLSRDFLGAIDQSRGRFRSFLLASLEHFLSHERDKEQALKRGGATRTLSLDADAAETRYRHEPTDHLTPERVFERRWGLTVMERLQVEFSDQPARFDLLKPCLTGDSGDRYQEIARNLDASRFPGVQLLDARVQKQLALGKVRATLNVDVFNVLNTGSTLRQFTDAVTTTFRRPLEIVAPRLVRLGLQLRF